MKPFIFFSLCFFFCFGSSCINQEEVLPHETGVIESQESDLDKLRCPPICPPNPCFAENC